MNFLEIQNVTKKFGDYFANDKVCLNIPKGTVFGLLGPNGAGKTTLIRAITRILIPDSGTILFEGKPHQDKYTERIGYMPEERGLYKNMTVYDQLVYLGKLKGLSASDAKKSVNHWLQKLDIESWKSKKTDELSKGMGQKVQFIATVVHNPDLIILDEPFSGLDPINSKLIEDEIQEMKASGKTIIFSTHRMEQVEQICDEIVLINKGKNILSGKVKELRKQFRKNRFHVAFSGSNKPQNCDAFAIEKITDEEAELSAAVNSTEIIKALIAQHIQISEFREILPSVQEIFIEQVNAAHA